MKALTFGKKHAITFIICTKCNPNFEQIHSEKAVLLRCFFSSEGLLVLYFKIFLLLIHVVKEMVAVMLNEKIQM